MPLLANLRCDWISHVWAVRRLTHNWRGLDGLGNGFAVPRIENVFQEYQSTVQSRSYVLMIETCKQLRQAFHIFKSKHLLLKQNIKAFSKTQQIRNKRLKVVFRHQSSKMEVLLCLHYKTCSIILRTFLFLRISPWFTSSNW